MELTETEIVRLAGRRSDGPIVSCYLDVDGRRQVRPDDYQRELSHLLRRARERPRAEVIEADLRRIERHVASDLDRSRIRGLAMFSSVEAGLWEVVELPVPVRSHLVVNPAPAVQQLESIIQEHEPLAVLLVDKQRARLFEFTLGELVEQRELVDELPRDYDDRGDRPRGSVDDHVDAMIQQHVRNAAAAAFELFKRRPFDHLAVGGSEAVLSALTDALHPYLGERLHEPRLDVPVQVGLDELRRVVMAVDERIERRREHERVSALRAELGAGGRAVAGLPDVLDALAERRVARLLVSDGYRDVGWRCGSCDRLAALGRACPTCQQEMTEVEDVVEEAVDEAIAEGCRVEVCVDNADLDVLGRVAAELRY